MLDLITHVVKISAHRDRTEINSAMVDALNRLFQPRQTTIYRCYTGRNKAVFFPCAGIGPNGAFLRNAYLPDRQFCHGIDQDRLLQRCRAESSVVLERRDDGSHRIVFPIIRREEPSYMIDLVLHDEFSADQRAALMGLIEYFNNHIALLDYGEGDSLTGLLSRKTFDKHLFELLGQAANDERLGGNGNGSEPRRRRGRSDAASHWLAVCDIDHFKQVNDNFGHLIGDEVLILVAQVMRRSFRFDDQLFRFGGEEFVALLQPTDAISAQATLERFRSQIASQVFSRIGHITISIGFSHLQPHDTPADAIDRADEALYFAKRHGRNRIACRDDLVANRQLPERERIRGEIELF
ncbi:MAG: GGDEF domain-containing protein [Azonexus sp.]|jgi:diguanylate cyclase (GGDEF)-like protein|uniref:GGDEF domain-containing protein n=1 Tax=Azonexus sp. TaxID=1872668 RepID=UPI002827153C|nr:GGDEF domain-containing protein [Azonexus sp.]MDR0775533.1 GGDEF domain-containing protein [Azonexus sp.]